MRDEKYLIWSNEHMSWWGPNSHGYAYCLENAGRYSRKEALEICKDANEHILQSSRSYTANPNEIPIPESLAVELGFFSLLDSIWKDND